MNIVVGELWYARFPLEENPLKWIDRPVLVLNVFQDIAIVLSAKITRHTPRDEYDIPIQYYKSAGLSMPSVVRVSKIGDIPFSDFRRRIGVMQKEDFNTVVTAFTRFIDSITG